jgi:hypothetical protein
MNLFEKKKRAGKEGLTKSKTCFQNLHYIQWHSTKEKTKEKAEYI